MKSGASCFSTPWMLSKEGVFGFWRVVSRKSLGSWVTYG